MVKARLVWDVADIYILDASKLSQLERTGEKSISNLLDAIERSKTRPLWRLIFGLGILHVGETSSRELAAHFQSIEALMNASAEELQRIPDVGEVVGASIHQFFQEPHNRDLIATVEKGGPETNRRTAKNERFGDHRNDLGNYGDIEPAT